MRLYVLKYFVTLKPHMIIRTIQCRILRVREAFHRPSYCLASPCCPKGKAPSTLLNISTQYESSYGTKRSCPCPRLRLTLRSSQPQTFSTTESVQRTSIYFRRMFYVLMLVKLNGAFSFVQQRMRLVLRFFFLHLRILAQVVVNCVKVLTIIS